jgi:hypothetical protein
LGEGGFGALEAEAREPAQGGALEPLGLGLVDGDTDGERVGKRDPRQLAAGVDP